MTVCRTCLLHFESAPKYIISYPSEENCRQDNTNSITNGILVKTMIEKCMPELDLDICDSPAICDRCYELLLSAYKFRLRCVETEEKIYNYIEINNLRLGESIDLNFICEKNPYLVLDERINDRTKTIKDEIFEYEEMPVLQPEADVVKPERNSVGTDPDTRNNEITNNESEDTQNEVETNINTNKEDVNSNTKGNEAESNSDGFNSDEENHEEYENDSNKTSKYDKRPFRCDRCEYSGKNAKLLKKHKSKCKGKDVTTYQCAKCTYSTVRCRNFKRHLLTHGGKRPWVCAVCEKGFTERHHLRDHMLKHSDNPLPYQCQKEGCSFASARKCDLTSHLVRHMKNVLKMCKYCMMSFPTKEQLLKHDKTCKTKMEKKKIRN